MRTRLLPLSILTALLTIASASAASAQILIPTQAHETLDLELASLRDNITFYMGDPQQLLLLRVTHGGITPRAEYESQTSAVLRILDSDLFSERPRDAEGKPPEEQKEAGHSQNWDLRLCPAGPTKFVLQLEQGESNFDFTDLQVRKVDLVAKASKLEVGFRRTNPIQLEVFAARLSEGSLDFRGLLNARAKDVAVYVPGSTCMFEVTGKEFEGETAITVTGAPAAITFVVSRKIGVRVQGPAATIAPFQSPQMSQVGAEWVSQGYDTAKCRVRFSFAEEVSNVTVNWK